MPPKGRQLMESNPLTYIVDTPHYSLAVVPSKERIYCTLSPYTTEFPDADEIFDSWLKIGSSFSHGFTLVLDACAEKVQRPEVIRFLLNVQKIAAGNGLLQLVDIVSGPPFAHVLHDQIANMAVTKDCRKVFPNRAGAEEWLDSLVS